MHNNHQSNHRQKSAFTVIEVVLVLAIAGLIFLMVFIALPALQRSQRNTRRRQDLTRITSAIIDYQATNGRLPFGIKNSASYLDEDFVSRYIDSSCQDRKDTSADAGGASGSEYSFENCGEKFTDPNGSPYTLRYDLDLNIFSGANGSLINISTSYSFSVGKFTAFTHASCGENSASGTSSYKVRKSPGANDFALVTILEGGAFYCQDNQ